MNQKKLITIIAAVILIAGGAYYFASTGNNDVDTEALLAEDALAALYNETNTVEVEIGSVLITRADGTEETHTEMAEVGIGDTVKVNADSTATLTWFDGSVSRMQAGTELAITKADYSPENVAETHVEFEVKSGEVWNKVIDLVDENSTFVSKGGTVVAGVRGSAYNFIVDDEEAEVESFEHAAFVEDEDGNEIVLTEGEKASVDGEMEVDEMSEEEQDKTWVKLNKEKDKEVIKEVQKRNAERLAKLVGPLPGEPGYENKIKAMQRHVDAIEDPDKKAAAEARLLQFQTRELVAAVMAGKKNATDVTSKLEMVKNQIEEADLTDLQKSALRKQIQGEVKALDKALNQVIPTKEKEELYAVKEILRANRIELEDDEELKDRLEQKVMERRIFDVSDLSKAERVSEAVMERMLEKIEEDQDRMQDRIEDLPKLQNIQKKFEQRIQNQVLQRIKAGNLDPEKARRLKAMTENNEALEDKAEEIRERLKNKVQEKTEAKKTPTKPTPEVIQKSPAHQGASTHKPAPVVRPPRPTPDVIEKSPAHQGPSNL